MTTWLAAAAAAAIAVGLLWHRPRLALVIWLMTIATVPTWVAVYDPLYLPIHSIVALVVVIAIGGSEGFKFARADYYFCVCLLGALATVPLAGGSGTLWLSIVVQWGFAFFVARVVVPAAGLRFAANTITLIMGAVAVCAIIESLFSWHPYTNFFSTSPGFEYWGGIQIRSGVERSEWAFGHSIALSGSLALAIPFVFISSFRSVAKLSITVVIIGGTMVSLSRGGITAAVLTLFLCYLTHLSIRRSRVAMGVLTGSVALGLLLVPGRISEFVFGLTSETQQSAAYRGQLYNVLLPQLEAFGPSEYVTSGRNESVDSAFLYLGVNYGWLVLLLATIPLAIILIRLIKGTTSLIEVGVLGQLPLLLTVALITQYQSLLFFVVGIACNSNLLRTDTDSSPGTKPEVVRGAQNRSRANI